MGAGAPAGAFARVDLVGYAALSNVHFAWGFQDRIFSMPVGGSGDVRQL